MASWWKWALPIGAAVAAPFTFGGSLAALGIGGGAAAAGAGAGGGLTAGLMSAIPGAIASQGVSSAIGAAAPSIGSLLMPSLIQGGTQLATGALGAHAASSASQKASDAQLQGIQAQLDYEREKDAQAKAQWDARQAQLAPFRQAAYGVLRSRAAALGLPDPSPMAAPTYTPPSAAPVAQLRQPPTALRPNTDPNARVVTAGGQTLGQILASRGQ